MYYLLNRPVLSRFGLGKFATLSPLMDSTFAPLYCGLDGLIAFESRSNIKLLVAKKGNSAHWGFAAGCC